MEAEISNVEYLNALGQGELLKEARARVTGAAARRSAQDMDARDPSCFGVSGYEHNQR